MQYPAQRVGVFVDVQNMYYSARALFEQKVDFGEILKEAVGERHLIRAFAYVIQAENEDEGSFFTALEDRGYELRAKQLLNFYGGNSKGDWDVGIAMDVVRMLPKLDVVVLVSGDGDFADLLRYVKSRGVRAEVMAFGSSASSQLREEADALLDLSQDPKRFLIRKKTQPIQKKPRTLESQQRIQLAEAQQSQAQKPMQDQQREKQRREGTAQEPSQAAQGKPFVMPGASTGRSSAATPRAKTRQKQSQSKQSKQQRSTQAKSSPSQSASSSDSARQSQSK